MRWDGMKWDGMQWDGQDNMPSNGYLSFHRVDSQKCVSSSPEWDSHS